MFPILIECKLPLNLTQGRHHRLFQESTNSYVLSDGVGFNITVVISLLFE